MGPVISANQARQQYQALPDYAKRKQAAPMGHQQFGSAERYHMAGVAPGWFNPALGNQKQYENLLEVEEAKRQERFNKLTPPTTPRTTGAPVNVNTLFQSDLQGLLTALTRGQQAVQENVQNSPQREEFSPEIQAIRDQFINTLIQNP